MKCISLMAGAALLLAGCSTFAHAATVGTLTCTAEKQQVKVNLSYFEFGAKEPVSSTATTPTQLLSVHAALSQFGPLFESVNHQISSCEIVATLSDGTQADFVFSGISLRSVTATARTPKVAGNPAALHTDAVFTFDKIKVKSSGGTDDGGTDGGWAAIAGSGPTESSSQ